MSLINLLTKLLSVKKSIIIPCSEECSNPGIVLPDTWTVTSSTGQVWH